MLLDVWERYRGVSVIIFESFVAISCENPAFAVCQCYSTFESVTGKSLSLFLNLSLLFLVKIQHLLFVNVPRRLRMLQNLLFVNVTRRLRALQGSLCHYFWIFRCYFLWKSSICCLSMLLDVWERYREVSVIIFESFVAISCENPAFAVCQCSSTFESVKTESLSLFSSVSLLFLVKIQHLLFVMFLDVWECYRICCFPMFVDVWECYRGVSVIIFLVKIHRLLFVNVPPCLRISVRLFVSRYCLFSGSFL